MTAIHFAIKRTRDQRFISRENQLISRPWPDIIESHDDETYNGKHTCQHLQQGLQLSVAQNCNGKYSR
jgi:hypothetical protein